MNTPTNDGVIRPAPNNIVVYPSNIRRPMRRQCLCLVGWVDGGGGRRQDGGGGQLVGETGATGWRGKKLKKGG